MALDKYYLSICFYLFLQVVFIPGINNLVNSKLLLVLHYILSYTTYLLIRHTIYNNVLVVFISLHNS